MISFKRLNDQVETFRKATTDSEHALRASLTEQPEVQPKSEDSNEWGDDWGDTAWPTAAEKASSEEDAREITESQAKPVDHCSDPVNGPALAKLEEELRKLQRERDASLEELDREHQAVVDRLLQERVELKALCEKQKCELTDRDTRLTELQECKEQLERENAELIDAYNELNDSFEEHKMESSDVTTSNRELEGRLEALKNDLFEYEEKYERCKAENQLAMQQLENLSNEFRRLKAEWLKSSMNSDLRNWQSEVIKLSGELEESLQKRHELVSSISEYEDIACTFQKHIERLKTENERLRRVSAEQQQELQQFEDVRDCLDDLRSEMDGLVSVLRRYDESYASRYENLLKSIVSLKCTRSFIECPDDGDDEPATLEHKRAVEDLNHQNQSLAKKLKECQDVCSYQGTVIVVLRQKVEKQFWDNYHILRLLDLYRSVMGPEAASKVEALQVQPNFALKAIAYEHTDNEGDARPKTVSEIKSESAQSYVQAFRRCRTTSDSVLLHCRFPNYRTAVSHDVSESVEITELDDASVSETGRRKHCGARKRFHLSTKHRQSVIRASLRRTVERLSRKLEGDKKRIAHLNTMNASLTELGENLKEQLAEYEKQYAAQAKKVESLQAERLELDNILASKEAALKLEEQKGIALLMMEKDKAHGDVALQQCNDELLRVSGCFEQVQNELLDSRKTVQSLNDSNSVLRHSRRLFIERLNDVHGKLHTLKEDVAQQKEDISSIMATFSAVLLDVSSRLLSSSQAVALEREKLVALVSLKHEESVRYHHEWQRVAELLQHERALVEQLSRQQVSITRSSVSNAETSTENDELMAGEEQQVAALSLQLQQANATIAQRDSLVNSLSAQVEDIKQRCRQDIVSVLEERDRLLSQVSSNKQLETSFANQMRLLQEAKGHSDSEVKRLKDHLISMEEAYTQEAVKCEEREISLRDRVRDLEAHKQLLGQIEKLQDELTRVIRERDAVQSQMTAVKEDLENSQTALVTLRTTLEHFQDGRASLVF
ncbi:unnamed protein product [Soboliphyme baturini]|uniref:Uncharacterized protein n=1 Tax=Soboliphyme baturini TaxID=241478 RepID=A0A3P8H9D1_9BILA|nr:unnamed protein product [Soboliphyme baturini]